MKIKYNNLLSIFSLGVIFILSITFIALASPKGYALEDEGGNDNSNDGIMLLNNNEPSVSLTIGGAGSNSEVIAQPGSGTVYSNHTITIGTTNGENLFSYSLTITAPASLSGSNGGTLTGAGGKAGNGMSDNTWGYYYNKDGATSESNFGTSTFNSFTGTAQTLESGSGAPSTTSKSLVLAAKFGSESTNTTSGVEAGHYRGTINLSLVATPKTLYTYSITYDANGGSGASSKWSTTDYNDSLTTTISSTTPTRTNYTFLGWSKSNSATSATYSTNGSITLNASNGREITLYAIWRRTFTLTLDANGGTGGPGSQTCYIYNAGTSCSITISSTKPTRTGYDFQGWGASSTTTTVSYNPGDSITLNADKTIYAVWQAQGPSVSGFGGITQMQQMTSSICSGASANATGQLYDTRDNSTYTIKKIGSKCWMTQNLRLSRESINAKDPTNTTGRITTSDSNTSGNYDIPASVAVTSDTITGDDTVSVFSSSNTAQQVRKSTNSTYGAYYSWCAATANTCGSATSNGSEVSSDICPKGWQLPSAKSGTRTNDFAVAAGLTSTNITANTNYWSSLSSPSFASNALTINGVSWAAAGIVYTSGLNYTGTHGYYWSRTAISSTAAYLLLFYSSYFGPSFFDNRYYGNSVRCVAK